MQEAQQQPTHNDRRVKVKKRIIEFFKNLSNDDIVWIVIALAMILSWMTSLSKSYDVESRVQNIEIEVSSLRKSSQQCFDGLKIAEEKYLELLTDEPAEDVAGDVQEVLQ